MLSVASAALCIKTRHVVVAKAANYAKNGNKTHAAQKNNVAKRKKTVKNLLNQNKSITFAAAFSKRLIMVPWMSGLVNGLQNRLQQFESARHLLNNSRNLD